MRARHAIGARQQCRRARRDEAGDTLSIGGMGDDGSSENRPGEALRGMTRVSHLFRYALRLRDANISRHRRHHAALFYSAKSPAAIRVYGALASAAWHDDIDSLLP